MKTLVPPIASRTLLAVLVALFFASCGSKQEAREYKFDEAFAPYIAAYTSNKISRQSTIKVRLNENAVQESQIGVTLEESPFSFDPEIEGKTVWLDERTVQFEPSEPMPTDQFYQATFQLGN